MSDRHERVSSLVKELVATFIQGEANPNPMITITHVGMSPDYRNATIFFTTIPEGRENDALVFLKRFGGEIRQYVKKKSDLKIIPYFEFSIDLGERHRQHIDEISRDIKKETD